eukprot:TRINITY_DN1540_c0_g1_i1.p1 TRINITY_DN1540_c0_g1~~TRINITY_DN1540_c0_g1_i1.p1  ORF type:complete len:814 (-),score=300.27 TRINITY_DN1540_c0_g1_i1:2235-4676(-)
MEVDEIMDDEGDNLPLASLVTKKRAIVESDSDDDKPIVATSAVKSTAVPIKKETEKKPPVKTTKSPAKTTKSPAKPTKSPAKSTKRNREDSSDSDSDSDSSSSDSDSSGSDSSDSDSDSDSSSSSSDSDDDSKKKKPAKPKAKPKAKASPKKAPAKKTPASPKKSPVKKEKTSESTPKRKVKKEEEEREDKYWEKEANEDGTKWTTLVHQGVLFPPPYKPHGIKMLYEGKPVELSPAAEEAATLFSQYLETNHMQKPQFSKNFFKEFLEILNEGKEKKAKKHVIQEFSKCDFGPIHSWLMAGKEAKKQATKEEKLALKKQNEEVAAKYGFAMVDGHKEKVGNFKVEPPGIFLGRGDHPKAGQIKKRIHPEDVTINIGKKSDAPPCPVEGHDWKEIVVKPNVAWLAFWRDPITEGFKYVWLAASSGIKGRSDMKKFETAQKLKKKIVKIRKEYMADLADDDEQTAQRATALYVIDHLALRVGNEKGDDEADTVGCCSLRVEHITLKKPKTIEFDFLGKDSMPYKNSVEVDEKIFANFKRFMKNKKPKDDIFDRLSTTNLNAHLKKMMKGLTAKVFRTYNASITLQNELANTEIDEDATVDQKMLAYNRANRQVAILCNHQRTVSKGFGASMGKVDEKIQEIDDEIQVLKDALGGKRRAKKPKVEKVVKKEESDSESSDSSDSSEEDTKKKKAQNGKSGKEEVKEGKKEVKKEVKKEEKKEEKKEKKEIKIPDTPEKIQKAIEKLKARKDKWITKKTEKEELKTVSLTTSKINYIDPRISVAWAKKNNVPIEKIFTKTLRQKFPWAMDVDEDWEF